MNKWKIFMFISLGALILVNGSFIFVENRYIKSDDKIEITEIKEETSNTEDVEVTLENGAEGVQATDDGQYIAYSKDGQVKIIDSKDDSIFNYEKLTNGNIVYFKWVSGRKYLFIMEKVEEDGDIYLKPVVLNAKSKEASTLTDFNRKEMKLLINDNETVENIVFATRSNTNYIQLKKDNGSSDLYAVDVMNEVSKVRKNVHIDNMVVTPTKTKAVMEMDSNITLLDNKGNIEIPGVEKYKIIGFDKNDKIYIGNEHDGKITEVYSSEVLDNNVFSWEKITLDEPLSINDIKVDYSGKVYLIYKDKGVIKEASTGASVACEGDILQAYSDGVISIEDGKIIKIIVK